MKINKTSKDSVYLAELKDGEVFEWNGNVCMACGGTSIVSLESGYLWEEDEIKEILEEANLNSEINKVTILNATLEVTRSSLVVTTNKQ